MRVLVGGVGYRNLRDYSFGVLVSDALGARSWPDQVSVEDISYSPIALVQRLEDDPPGRRFDLAIVVGAAPRGRPAGTVTMYRWDKALPTAERIQAAVAEAVTGVISLDNTLVVAAHFGALPPAVIVVEAEPEVHEFGDQVTPAIDMAIGRTTDAVTRLVLDPPAAARLPEAPLGGRREGPGLP